MRIIVFVACVAVLPQSGCGNQVGGKLTVEEFIASADKVELFFVRPRGPNRTDPPAAVLTEKTDITNFSGDLVLEPKEPCQCAHLKMIRFRKGGNVLIASVCNHCFNIIDEDRVVSERRLTRFHMPKGLWTKLCRLEPKQEKRK